MENQETHINQAFKVTSYDSKNILETLTDQDIAVFDYLGTLPIERVHSEAFIVVLCTNGKATCKVEDKVFDIAKNDVFISHPNQFVNNVMVSYDFTCQGTLMSPRYFENMIVLGGNVWEASLILKECPVVHLSEEEADNARFNYEIVRRKLNETDRPHHKEIVKYLLQALIYDFYDTIVPKLGAAPSKLTYSAGENLFKRFAQMVTENAPIHRDVSYYAERLYITPKYLSTVCKKQSGKSASAIINTLTINYIRQMLTSSDKSIKEIANEAGFENLSFFGKYVKRELGMSPREFRQKKE